jgi:transposase InsO family protein
MARYRIYDHRIKQAIAKARNPDLFPSLNIPRSSAMTWIREGVRDVVTNADLDIDRFELLQKVAALEAAARAQTAKGELVKFTFRVFGLQIQYQRLPNADTKRFVLDQIKKAAELLPLTECLEAIGLSTARYYNWMKRQVRCLLPAQSSCPKLSPTKLTTVEINAIKELVSSKDFGHFSIPSLAWFAKREGKVFASLSVWYRVIHEFGLRRPLQRIYPPKPRIGIRASGPNQIWHLDQTLLRLENGTRVYIQAVIDNFSRHVLAWHASLNCGGLRTKVLLERALTAASEFFPDTVPTILTDSGCENLNKEVDTLIDADLFKRLVAQIEIEFSNSMIEAFFRTLKHRWLYLIGLPSFDAVVATLEVYMPEYTHRIPLDALRGGTPFEVFTGKWTEAEITALLASLSVAKDSRLIANKSFACGRCPV